MNESVKVYVNSLVLEVTRRCNMRCPHCLRGDEKKMDMQESTVDKILDTVDYIGTVTFSGGEPSLNIPLIRYFFEEAEKRGKLPSSFYIVTNGKAHMLDLAQLVLEWYAKFDEPDMCGVTISQDAFHDINWDDGRTAPVNYLAGLACYRPDDKKHSSNDMRWVQPRGRALENGLGGDNAFRKINEDTGRLYVDTYIPEGDNEYDASADIDLLYVSATEKISGDCDMPYAEIDRLPYSIDTLYEAIEAATED